MKRLSAIVLAAALLALSATSALAAPKWGPDTTKRATPAHACAAIPGFLEWAEGAFGVDLVYDFNFADCVSTLAGGVPDVLTGFGNPYEQCAYLETINFFGEGNYPIVLHGAPGDPFPNLLVTKREECARALYTFHAIVTILGENGIEE